MSKTEQALRAPEAARRLGLTTEDVLRLMVERQLRTIVVNGIAHVPESAIEEYRAAHS